MFIMEIRYIDSKQYYAISKIVCPQIWEYCLRLKGSMVTRGSVTANWRNIAEEGHSKGKYCSKPYKYSLVGKTTWFRLNGPWISWWDITNWHIRPSVNYWPVCELVCHWRTWCWEQNGEAKTSGWWRHSPALSPLMVRAPRMESQVR